MKKILSLNPIIHLNEDEALQFTQCETVKNAANEIFRLTNELVIVTCGERGVYYKDKSSENQITGFNSIVVDTIGAGDSHLGGYMAALQMGYEPIEAIALANKIAAKVVQIEGASLSIEQFRSL